MEPKSLGYRTELALLKFGATVKDRGSYIVAETPENPGYFWGNFLFMEEAPRAGDYSRWTSLFKQEFAHLPLVKHMTFGWDSTSGDVGEAREFQDQGFELDPAITLAAEALDLKVPLKMNSEVEIRALSTDEEWASALENQMHSRLADFKLETYLPFKTAQMLRFRKMTEAGLGFWYGAFLQGQLVADCGLFFSDKIGRYQTVGTDPDFRRRGICAKLIHETARLAFESGAAETLVMIADEGYHAAKIYESVGFKIRERITGMHRYPKETWLSTSN